MMFWLSFVFFVVVVFSFSEEKSFRGLMFFEFLETRNKGEEKEVGVGEFLILNQHILRC